MRPTVKLPMAGGRKRRRWPTLLLAVAIPASVAARSDPPPGDRFRSAAAATPAYCNAAHDIGRIALSVGNSGAVGTGFTLGNFVDCFTGDALPSCIYPRGGFARYLFGATIWIGAVVGEDTLVSAAGDDQSVFNHEFHPDGGVAGRLAYRSTTDPSSRAYEGAVSEQDYVAVVYDTCSTCSGVQVDPVDGRPHRPLHVKVTQSSYAWSYTEVEDLVFFDYTIENIGSDTLAAAYFGVFVDIDIHLADGSTATGHADDHSGFLASAPNPWMPEACRDTVTLNAAWTADNEGDFGGLGPRPTVPGVTALFPLSLPDKAAGVAFNWWNRDQNPVLDFGPQGRASFRMFASGGLGSPIGDRDKYHVLSNGEIDYDQVRLTTVSGSDSLWLPPSYESRALAEGADTRFALSLGPFDLKPGETRQTALAFTVGDDFHSVPFNSINLPDNPGPYFAQVDFGDLIENAVMARYVYDNPGVDTDGDGYAGEFEVCEGDTVWYRGDSIPDWRAATAPPAPRVWLESRLNGFHLRWNGLASETATSWFSNVPTYEGYAVYLGFDSTASAFARVAAYDVEDYRRYLWDAAAGGWVPGDRRILAEAAVCGYAPGGCDDPDWSPVDFTRQAPYVMPGNSDSVFYFEPIGANASRLGLETPFEKRYPDAVKPAYTSPGQVPPDSVDYYLTDDGYLKYYEWEYALDGLLGGETYWVAVTAFDCGSGLAAATPLESQILTQARSVRTLYSDSACCRGSLGNVDCDPGDEVGIADVMLLVEFLFLDGPALCCPAEADLDYSGQGAPTPEDITLGDVARLIDHLFISGRPLSECR